MTLQQFLEFQLISVGGVSINTYHLLAVGFLFVISWVLILISGKIIRRQIGNGRFDEGRGHAFTQILRYTIIVITILVGLDFVGVKLTLLLAGSAALLVGIGLGLQQVFNDIVSGIILLFEGTVTVGDIVELDTVVGKVKKISIRTSLIETRDRIIIVVPNSKLVSDNVINWSHNRQLTRFNIKVGVAYGSDVPLVMRLLTESALEHQDIVNSPDPQARFIDFGESSLDFELLFFSIKAFEIELIKSEVRVTIDQKFRDHNVTIPFPQRDLHLKSSTENPFSK